MKHYSLRKMSAYTDSGWTGDIATGKPAASHMMKQNGGLVS